MMLSAVNDQPSAKSLFLMPFANYGKIESVGYYPVAQYVVIV